MVSTRHGSQKLAKAQSDPILGIDGKDTAAKAASKAPQEPLTSPANTRGSSSEEALGWKEVLCINYSFLKHEKGHRNLIAENEDVFLEFLRSCLSRNEYSKSDRKLPTSLIPDFLDDVKDFVCTLRESIKTAPPEIGTRAVTTRATRSSTRAALEPFVALEDRNSPNIIIPPLRPPISLNDGVERCWSCRNRNRESCGKKGNMLCFHNIPRDLISEEYQLQFDIHFAEKEEVPLPVCDAAADSSDDSVTNDSCSVADTCSTVDTTESVASVRDSCADLPGAAVQDVENDPLSVAAASIEAHIQESGIDHAARDLFVAAPLEAAVAASVELEEATSGHLLESGSDMEISLGALDQSAPFEASIAQPDSLLDDSGMSVSATPTKESVSKDSAPQELVSQEYVSPAPLEAPVEESAMDCDPPSQSQPCAVPTPTINTPPETITLEKSRTGRKRTNTVDQDELLEISSTISDAKKKLRTLDSILDQIKTTPTPAHITSLLSQRDALIADPMPDALTNLLSLIREIRDADTENPEFVVDLIKGNLAKLTQMLHQCDCQDEIARLEKENEELKRMIGESLHPEFLSTI